MTQTKSSDLYDPEVWADLAAAQFTKKAVVGTSSAVLSSGELTGVPGSTVKFPSWMTLSDLDDLTEGTSMTPVKLTQKNSEATVKEAGKAVEITDTADLNGLGNPQDEAIRQFGVLAARKVDADLITVATTKVTGGITYADGSTATDSACLAYTAGTTTAAADLSWDVIAEALEKFGDDFEPEDFTGLFINSAQRTQAWKDDQFIAASELSAAGASSVVARGVIGAIAGLPVIVTDRVTSGKPVVLKKQSLGLLYKRRPIVEQDRDILARTNVVTTNLHYAVKRLNDAGVLQIDLTKQA